jgi:hypothetical protein
MYRTRIRATLTCIALLTACGDNRSPCDYTETDDADNATTGETTNLSVGTDTIHVCGGFDQGHFTSATTSADDDRYRISVTVATPLLVDVTVPDGLDVLTGVTVRFYATTGDLVSEAKPAFSDHAAFLVTLQPGDYDMELSADAAGELQGDPIDYRVRVAPMPACDESTNAATYTEKTADNDAVAVDFTKDPSFTAMASSPEASSLTVSPGNNASIVGSIDTTVHSDQYLDRDTYTFTTGDRENEIAIRLSWDGSSSDLDYIVFEADTMLPIVASNLASDTGPELQMFSVKPNTTYWLWVGGFQGSSATMYRADVCGWQFYY